MSEPSIEEYTQKMRSRYGRMTGRKARGRLLDEFVEITGWTEVDTVAHCGGDMGGDFIWTLTSVEVSSGWTGLRAVWNRRQQAGFEALESIWESQPFDLLGVDSDNGGEFRQCPLSR